MAKHYERTVDCSSIIQFKKKRFSFPSCFRGEKIQVKECEYIQFSNSKYCRRYVRLQSTIYLEDYIDAPELVEEEITKYLYISSLIGRNVYFLSSSIIRYKRHPYLAFRTIEAIFYLAEKHGCDEVEQASEYCLNVEKPFYSFLKKTINQDGIFSYKNR